MADVTPNYKLEQQRLRAQIAAQRSNIESQKLAILEMVDRKQRHEENIAASYRAIEQTEIALKGLIETYGELSDAEHQALRETLR